MIILIGLAAVMAIWPVHDALRRPDLRRVAGRSVARRPGESSLVIVGAALGTAIMAVAFIVGDTFEHSIRDVARTQLGPVDHIVGIEDPEDLDAAALALTEPPIPGVDGVLASRFIHVTLATADGANVSPSASVTGMSVEEALKFGADPSITGLSGLDPPTPDQIIINTEVQAELGVTVGDEIVLMAFGQQRSFAVSGVMPFAGLGGFTSAIVAPELLDALATATPEGALGPAGQVLVSAEGGVFDSVDDPARETAIVEAVEQRLDSAAIDHRQWSAKFDTLNNAEEERAEITEIFVVVGGFSALSGVLLIVNLLVMLSEERKPTLGVLRAVGWSRLTLVRALGLEGAIYAVVASALGAVAGIGFGWLVVRATRFITESTDGRLVIMYDVRPRSLIIAAMIGFCLTMVVMWAMSARIVRLNIVSAIRDLPNHRSRNRLLPTLGAAVLVVVGLSMFTVGYLTPIPALALLGPALGFAGVGILATGLIGPEASTVGAGIATIGWGSFFLRLLPGSVTDDIELGVFLLLGVLLVAGATAVMTVVGPQLRALIDRRAAPRLAASLGLSYPVARPFRTAVSLAMFSLVVFSLAFLAALTSTVQGQSGEIVAENAAGRDVLLQTTSANPVTTEELEAHQSIVEASPVWQGGADFSAPFSTYTPEEPQQLRVSGIEPGFAGRGTPTLARRHPDYASDAEVFEAVASDGSKLVVPEWFLGSSAESDQIPIGAMVNLHAGNGETHELEVIGTIQTDLAFAGPWLSAERLRSDLTSPRLTRFYVTGDDELSPDQLAATINADFILNGADAESFQARVQRFLDRQTGFYRLLGGYLALGLLIGVAGLGVTLVRAVRERRREIGMLRSMGFTRSGVRRMFVFEAMYITLSGVLVGVGLGAVTAHQVIIYSNAFSRPLAFVLPTAALIGIVAVTVAWAGLAALIPAHRAAKLVPADALRIAE